MDSKTLLALVLTVAVAGVAVGFLMASPDSGDDPAEDGPVIYEVSRYFDQPMINGTMVVRITFSADPVVFQLYYDGMQLRDDGWQHGNYTVTPSSLSSTPAFTMPVGVTTYEQLLEGLEVRSQYVDLAPGTL